jgi:hypothetical protein
VRDPGTTEDPVGIPRSPSGRIPQWVMDEAVGRPVTPVPFRAPLPYRPPRRSRARGLITVLGALAVVAVIVLAMVGAQGLFPGSSGGPSSPLAAAPRQGPPPGHEESAEPLGTPPEVAALPEGSDYRFRAHQDDSAEPVTWSPCRPIHYVVRPANQPPGGDALLREAFASVGAATGLRFVDDGTTDEAPSEQRDIYQPDRYGDRWAPVLVAWATSAEVPDFGVDVAGEAGGAWVTTSQGQSAYVSGVVYLDPAKLGGAEPLMARAIVLHELGHLVGLAHVDRQGALMFPRASSGVTDFGPGDRAGLAALGAGPCQPSI